MIARLFFSEGSRTSIWSRRCLMSSSVAVRGPLVGRASAFWGSGPQFGHRPQVSPSHLCRLLFGFFAHSFDASQVSFIEDQPAGFHLAFESV